MKVKKKINSFDNGPNINNISKREHHKILHVLHYYCDTGIKLKCDYCINEFSNLMSIAYKNGYLIQVDFSDIEARDYLILNGKIYSKYMKHLNELDVVSANFIKYGINKILCNKGDSRCKKVKKKKYHAVNEFMFNNELIMNSYEYLIEETLKFNAKFIFMSYPLLSVEPYKKRLGSCPIIFVSNKNNFEELVSENGTENVFSDMLAGVFGHSYEIGNGPIADNVANLLYRNLK